jgi:pyruvate/2-oxoglutarate dehydrogenase complex dihydrolipoamide dehydrogenase (E3) component
VEPIGYLDCVRDGRIEVCEGAIQTLQEDTARLINKDGEVREIKANNVILATGYNLVSTFIASA